MNSGDHRLWIAVFAVFVTSVVFVTSPAAGQEFLFISSREASPGALDYEIYAFDNGVQTQLTVSPIVQEHPVLVPGQGVYFAQATNDAEEILLMDPLGVITQVTTDGASGSYLGVDFEGNSHPFPAPDGLSFYCTTHLSNGDGILRRLNPDGTPFGPAPGVVVAELGVRYGHSPTVTLPSGEERLLFSGDAAGNMDLFMTDLDGSNMTALVTRDGYDGGAAPSPDGSRIAYSHQNAGSCQSQIWVKDLSSNPDPLDWGDPITVGSGLKSPFAWDGNDTVLHVSNEGGDWAIYGAADDPGTPMATLLVDSGGEDLHLLPDLTCGVDMECDLEADPRTVPFGGTVVFEGTVTGISPVEWTWEFGDGTTQTIMSSATMMENEHVYDLVSGVLSASVTVRDDCTPPNTVIGTVPISVGPMEIRRGDVDNNGAFNALVDGLFLLNFGFVPGSAVPPCMAAADADANRTVNALVDGLFLLNFGFIPGSPPPPAPGPFDCGPDQNGVDTLGCDDPSACL